MITLDKTTLSQVLYQNCTFLHADNLKNYSSFVTNQLYFISHYPCTSHETCEFV